MSPGWLSISPSYLPPSSGWVSGVASAYGAHYISPRLDLAPALAECAYCGNKWNHDVRRRHHNCPTCAGSFK